MVIPPVSLAFSSDVRLFSPGSRRRVEVDVTSSRAGASGSLHLETPAGWAATPISSPFSLGANGEHIRLAFEVTAPDHPETAGLSTVADVGGIRCETRRIEIRYDHIPEQLLQPPARLKCVCLDLQTRGRRVGYLPGAGDDVARCIEQMGYEVTTLSGADLRPERLKDFDAVVIGIRAFNVRTDLDAGLPALFAYVEAGGTVIAQYNRPDGLKASRLAPYDLKLSQDRVTDENAAMTFLAPEHPALSTPNKITGADFEGWVQERGLYFPNQWDDHFLPILACSDPGEPALKGALLIAPYGRGHFVYSGLAWFRQLPAGVPGAYRLFANLVSLGK
jgi:hypothetical protein